uniref:Reverse transcriptase Ty1/copia-type domain-containing protein n=1 Tax=Ananas comosus var. bracteatus TaxID=296719 RepID=A0A6V7QLF6_ANACO|nr:unnamed protein product [Ananas comosus var. bracteatus]
MVQEFEMTDLDLMNYFLGLEVTQGEKEFFVSQKKYISNLLERFGLKDCNQQYRKVDLNVYRSLIGSLLYVVHTRLDIIFATSLLLRFMEYPSMIHMGATKRILRYLKGTSDHGLWFTKTNNFSIFGFSDSDWAGFIDDRRSTSEFMFKLGSSMVCWSSRSNTQRHCHLPRPSMLHSPVQHVKQSGCDGFYVICISYHIQRSSIVTTNRRLLWQRICTYPMFISR